jgi:hypothetical protein
MKVSTQATKQDTNRTWETNTYFIYSDKVAKITVLNNPPVKSGICQQKQPTRL